MANREPFSADPGRHPKRGGAGREHGSQPLASRTILVVEDEFLIAEDLCVILKQAGADVIGPADSLPRAIRLFHEAEGLDAAMLNVDLHGVAVFPLVDELQAERVPMLPLTGYDDSHIPDQYSHIRRCNKPTGAARLVEELYVLLRPVAA